MMINNKLPQRLRHKFKKNIKMMLRLRLRATRIKMNEYGYIKHMNIIFITKVKHF